MTNDSVSNKVGAVAKGGYKPKPFLNSNDVKMMAFIPKKYHDIYISLAVKNNANMSDVARHALIEYAKFLESQGWL